MDDTNNTSNKKVVFWLGVLSLLGFFLTTYFLFNGSFLGKLDSKVNGLFISIQNPILVKLMVVLEFITSETVFAVLVVLLAVVFFYKKARKEAFFIAVPMFIGGVLVKLLKDVFEVVRPSAVLEGVVSSFSFPSGHTTITFLFLIVIGFLLIRGVQKPSQQKLIRWGFPFLALLIAFNRLYLGVHWFSDVIAGALLGSGVALISLYIYLRE